ncbi:elongation factor P maturation arginine rhamnosyltransferase EarP [Xylophilus sp. Leaf220]|uniref:elongation factor P maturation arginine rhamnosyltransferase EarP n=1 Tax=Xylophilus sp. Leaf220 TaxID=1735686 RepID=UPI0009E9E916|nr:elongation factor P maturation arginine rhamnosyltransferase EarP [Xylophilus sp. Leaf220]
MQWDLFCRVIDNYGDIGVCWGLAADLAGRGERVRLWIDDPAPLAWMAPGGAPGVEVLAWQPGRTAGLSAPCEVLVEAFGCDPDPAFLAGAAAQSRPPVWINLEYLSAEAYVERCHALPSPVMQGPLAGATKWFFYPGFTAATGGLLREPGLTARQAAFDIATARHAAGAAPGDLLVQLFCYEPAALAELLARLAHGPQPARLLVAAGRPARAVEVAIASEKWLQPASGADHLLSISKCPPVPQPAFDERLWTADLNFVRGEDSLVRALWAGKPIVWQVYPQDDGAHAEKLDAFLDWLQAPASLRRFHHVWNGTAPGPLPAFDLPAWQACATAARARLLAQDDLATQLCRLAAQKQ